MNIRRSDILGQQDIVVIQTEKAPHDIEMPSASVMKLVWCTICIFHFQGFRIRRSQLIANTVLNQRGKRLVQRLPWCIGPVSLTAHPEPTQCTTTEHSMFSVGYLATHPSAAQVHVGLAASSLGTAQGVAAPGDGRHIRPAQWGRKGTCLPLAPWRLLTTTTLAACSYLPMHPWPLLASLSTQHIPIRQPHQNCWDALNKFPIDVF